MTGGRWTTLDRVVSVGDGEAVGIRNVPNTLAIFDSHFPRFHVLPGVLILGSLGTLCGRAAREGDRRPLAARAAPTGSRFRHFVQPGDEIELTVKLKDLADDEAVLTGEASVDGKLVTRARKLRATPRGSEACAGWRSPASGSARRSGVGTDETWERLLEGDSAVGEIEGYDASRCTPGSARRSTISSPRSTSRSGARCGR